MTPVDAAWAALSKAAEAARGRRIAGLFDAEPDRLSHLTLAAAGLEIDLSKQPWSLADLEVLLDLAHASGVDTARAGLFAGGIVNASEGRPALHMALRAADGADYRAAGQPVSREVEATRNAMRAFHGEGSFLDFLRADPEVTKLIDAKTLESQFDLGYHTKQVDTVFKRVLGE